MPFEHPHLLWLLPGLVPALLGFLIWAGRRKRELAAQFVAARLLESLTVGVSPSRQKARLGLVVAAVGLLILVLARPQLGFSWEEAHSRGLDIVVAIDTSRSMLASDVSPNRLRRAQLAALDLKRLARTDRLGLVAFAGSAFLQCPLTLDDEAFRQSVEALDVNIIPQGGTALAEAIAAARSAFREGNDNHKVVVLFTDGEDHDGNALEAARQAAKEGLHLFTVGVGTPAGELLRTVDVQGRTEFIKDDEGNAVKSRLNEKLLREMAEATGEFYLPLSGANTMQALYDNGLAPLPKGDLASQRVKRPHERYQWLLGLVVALLLLEVFLPERAAAASPVAGTNAATAPSPGAKPAVAAAAEATLLVLLVSLGAAPDARGSSAEGLKQYEKGRYGRALAEYERLLKKHPEDPRLRFNAGTAAFQNKDYEEALNHLTAALITPDLTLQQRAYYNIGNTLFRLGEGESDVEKKRGQWQRALSSYESVLKLDPKDADAEFNRELVKRRLEQLKPPPQDQKNQDKPPPSDAAKQAKRQADDAVRRRDYHAALDIMENQLKIDPTTSYYADYIQRLRQINGISTPAPAAAPQLRPGP